MTSIDTWVFARGRWKVITDRGLMWMVICGLATAWVTGAVCGERFAEGRITSIVRREVDKRFAEITMQLDTDRREIDVLMRWEGQR